MLNIIFYGIDHSMLSPLNINIIIDGKLIYKLILYNVFELFYYY